MSKPKPKLLVVDDEPDQIRTIKNYFSRRGLVVFTATTGEEALALIKEDRPDLVLLDMKLPGNLEGADVLRILRKDDKDLKVAMVTGDILQEQKIQEITHLGIVDFLTKPVDFQTLEKVVKGALKGDYPELTHPKELKTKAGPPAASLRRISHDLSNITSDIANKCELYILDTEEGINKDKSEKERLGEAIDIIKSVLKSSERLSELIKRVSLLAKKEL
jgi:two-component system response regulator (stage 0 sporulation protein F)